MTTLPLVRRILLQRPLADVFAYLRDFSTIAQWDPGVLDATKITPGPADAGSQFALTLNVLGRAVPMQYTLIRCESPDAGGVATLVLDGRGEGFSALDTLRLSADGEGSTWLDYRADLQLGDVPGWLLPGLRAWGRRLADQAMTGLQRALCEDGPESVSVLGRVSERLVLPGMLNYTRRGYRQQHSRGLSRRLDGRTVGITGITSGLGQAAALELARLGATLVLVGRDRTRLEACVEDLRARSGSSAAMRVHEAELSSLASTRELAERLRRDEPALDVWINNAGALFNDHALTAEGHERSLAVNFLSPALLSQALAPALAARRGRLIQVVSGGLYTQPVRLDDLNYTTEPYNGPKAYARAKRALLDLTQRLAAAPALAGLGCHVMHPGWAATPGVASALPGFNQRLGERLRTPRMGADTMVWLASHPALDDPALSGRFWFDRAPRPTALLPGTASNAATVDALLARVANLSAA